MMGDLLMWIWYSAWFVEVYRDISHPCEIASRNNATFNLIVMKFLHMVTVAHVTYIYLYTCVYNASTYYWIEWNLTHLSSHSDVELRFAFAFYSWIKSFPLKMCINAKVCVGITMITNSFTCGKTFTHRKRFLNHTISFAGTFHITDD